MYYILAIGVLTTVTGSLVFLWVRKRRKRTYNTQIDIPPFLSGDPVDGSTRVNHHNPCAIHPNPFGKVERR